MANESLEDKLYLENLEEEVVQLGNVVTYKWLVRTLKVSANAAKRMLFEFVEKQKAAGVNLNVTYFVAGEKKSNDQNVPIHEIQIVPSSRLEDTKARFETITSLHVYGVHKAEIKDHNILYAVDYSPTSDVIKEIKTGCAITCPDVALRPENGTEIVQISESRPTVSSDEKKPERLKEPNSESTTSCKKTNPQSKATAVGSKKSNLESATGSKKPTKHPKGGNQSSNLVGMFENMGKKRKTSTADKPVKVDNKEDEEDEKVKTPTKHPKGRNQASILDGMFKNMGKKKKSVDKPVKVEDKEDEEDEKVEDAVILKESAKVPKKSQQRNGSKVVKIKEEPKETREKRKAKTETTTKKRRRIIQMSDSSSDEESQPESPIPTPYDSPEVDEEEEVEVVVKTPTKISGRNSVHKRKLVKESGMDEEGFLVTQNNWKDGSGSEGSGDENEDPIPKPKPEKITKEETKKVTPKNKQATMMNFFKKK